MEPGAPFNPFPGLRSFAPDEDHLFFGREREIDDLLRRLRSSRFVSVVGTSGSGKSSLVHSGLIPALQSGLMTAAGSSWRLATLRPGENPIQHLAAALDSPDVLSSNSSLGEANSVLLEVTLRRGALGLIEAVRQAKIPADNNLLVVVDQFEELFRFRRNRQIENSRDEAVAFVKLLLQATQQSDFPIYIVLTMRSDFIGECMEFPGLPEAVNAGQYLIPRMTREEVRSAITGPIAVGGGNIAPRLVSRLLNDLGDDHDQLPVLQHALMRTWDHWARNRQQGEPMDIADYEAIGTLRGALSLHAEEAFAETGSDRGRELTEKVFKALTDTFSDPRGLRRPTSVGELAEICAATEEEIVHIVEIFRRPGRSFLMPPSSVPLRSISIVDISHESLMRCWERLISWAEEERVSAATYKRLSQAAGWFEEGTAGLWRNPELDLGLTWKLRNHPNSAWAERFDSSFLRAMDFLDRSEQEHIRIEALRESERKKKLRMAWTVASFLGILLVVALGLAFLVWQEKNRAETNLQLAKEAVDESLSSAGRQQAREGADAPQLERFREELLQKAMSFYVTFTKQSPTSAAIQAEAALAHSRLGDINRLLSKHEDAVKEYDAAIGQFQALIKDFPKNPEYKQELAYSYNWLGETLRQRLEETPASVSYTFSDAGNAYDSALHLQADLHNGEPARSDYQQELARTYYNRGILHYDGKQLKDSEGDFRQAIQLLEPLSSQTDKSKGDTGTGPESAQDLARAYNDLGNLQRQQNRLSEAQELYARAIGIHENLTKSGPENDEYKFELAQFYENFADLWIDENQLDLAEKNNRLALQIIEQLASPPPSLGLEWAKAHMIRGWILEARGSGDAQAENQRSLELLESLKKYSDGRDNSQFHVMYMNLAENFVGLAEASMHSGNLAEVQRALQGFEQVISEVLEPNRSRLEKSYQALKGELDKRIAGQK